MIITEHITLDNLKEFILNSNKISLAKDRKMAVRNSRAFIKKAISNHKIIYGVNTGFGKLADVAIDPSQLEQLQKNLLMSHAMGVGPALANPIVKLIMTLKIISLAQGYSGVPLKVIDLLIKFIRHEIYPIIPSQGSVGASGDLAPLAHMSLALMGQSEVYYKKKIRTSASVLKKLNIKPLVLEPKVGIALINGTQASTALALDAFFKLHTIFDINLKASMLSFIAAAANPNYFDSDIQQARKQPGQIKVAKVLRSYTKKSIYKTNFEQVQAPYSLRCIPQVMGACFDQMKHAAVLLEHEANAATDNPLIFAEKGKIVFGGNFHAEPVAFAADNLALALCEIGSMSERRIALLLDENFSSLPAFLTKNPGVNSGLMMTQTTAAALVSENKLLSHPASVDSIPTSANQEDHVSMACHGAKRLHAMCDNLAYITALELICACQAMDLNPPKKLHPELKKWYTAVREILPYHENDYFISKAIENIVTLIKAS